MEFYSKATSLNPKYYIAYINKGYSLLIIGDLFQELTDFNKAII